MLAVSLALWLVRRRAHHDRSAEPFTIFWLTYASAGTSNRTVVLGPIVEIIFCLDRQLSKLTKAVKAVQKSWTSASAAPADIDLTVTGDLITAGKKLRQAILSVVSGLKPSDPLIIASNLAKLRPRLQSASSLFNESQAWFVKVQELGLKTGIPSNADAEELKEKMEIGVKGALTAAKEKLAEKEEKPSLGRDEDDISEEREEEMEEQGRLRA